MLRHLLVTSFVLALCAGPVRADESVSFDIRQLAVDANEGIAASDVDGDGKLDIVAGRFWYQNPSWAPRPLRNIDDWNGYIQSNGDFVFDVNKDGRPDVIAGSFAPSEVYWYENPGEKSLRLGQLWNKFLLLNTPQQRNEGTLMEDIDGDGRPEWISASWSKDVPMYICRLKSKEAKGDDASAKKQKKPIDSAAFDLVPHKIGSKGNGHGCGVGDLNGDGRKDVLVGQGWYEQPAEPWAGEWEFHKAWDLHASLPMLLVDVNADGKNDIIWGLGHDFGLFWWENQGTDADGELKFKEHVIDREYSQPHTLAWADLTGDGQPELITGKRYYAHNGGDPGGEQPPAMYYYTLDKKTAKFKRHTIEEGHVGTGLQIVVEDFDKNGKADIAVAGKSGTHLLMNKGQ